MAHLEDDRWIMVFYSGHRRGRNDIYGLTLRLNPETGKADADDPRIGEPVPEKLDIADDN
jgi:hypothetical protein